MTIRIVLPFPARAASHGVLRAHTSLCLASGHEDGETEVTHACSVRSSDHVEIWTKLVATQPGATQEARDESSPSARECGIKAILNHVQPISDGMRVGKR